MSLRISGKPPNRTEIILGLYEGTGDDGGRGYANISLQSYQLIVKINRRLQLFAFVINRFFRLLIKIGGITSATT